MKHPIVMLALLFSVLQVYSQANLEWMRRYDGSIDDRSYRMLIDQAGNLIVCGEENYGPLADIVVIKYNSNGDSLWTQKYN